MKTILWCVITTAIGAFIAPKFPLANPDSAWWGGGLGLIAGALLSYLPIFPSTWVEKVQRWILWRPKQYFWHNTRESLAHLIITELYVVMFGASLLAMRSLCSLSHDIVIRYIGMAFGLTCCLMLLIAIFALCATTTDICIIMNGEFDRFFHEEFNMIIVARWARRIALFYNPFVLPFTLLYHGAKALGVIR